MAAVRSTAWRSRSAFDVRVFLMLYGDAGHGFRTHAHADPDRPGVGSAEIAVPKSADTLSIEYLLRQFHIGNDPDYIMQMVYSQSFYDKVLDASLPVEDLLTGWGEGYAQAHSGVASRRCGTGHSSVARGRAPFDVVSLNID